MKKIKKEKRVTEIDEKMFEEKVNESNVLCLIHPEKPYSKNAVVQTSFNYDIEESFGKNLVSQISDTLLSSPVTNLVNKDYVVAVYGKYYENTGMYEALCSKPIEHNLPKTLSDDGWAKAVEDFCEIVLEEYRLGI